METDCLRAPGHVDTSNCQRQRTQAFMFSHKRLTERLEGLRNVNKVLQSQYTISSAHKARGGDVRLVVWLRGWAQARHHT